MKTGYEGIIIALCMLFIAWTVVAVLKLAF
jgi:hypothetical protein